MLSSGSPALAARLASAPQSIILLSLNAMTTPLSALVTATVLAAAVLSVQAQPAQLKLLPKDVTRVPVEFSGGHETDGRDGGRPVALIAAALGVTSDVFRDAFSNVHPAGPGRGPTGEEARQNKGVLMRALGKYGITNDKLDDVSNHYRYVRSRGELWPTAPAVANALVKGGTVIGYELIGGGSGYSSPPEVTVPNIANPKVKVDLSFNKSFEKNGTISALTVVPEDKK